MTDKPSMLLLSLCIVVTVSGCVSQTAKNEQSNIRLAILALHEEQILDNLLRTSLGLPILHMDYGKVTGTVKFAMQATLNGTDVTSTDPGHAGRKGRTRGVTFGAASKENTIQVEATPLISHDEVYLKYVRFLSDNIGNYSVDDKQTTCVEDLSIQRYGGFFCVLDDPASRKEFFQLALATSVLRAKSGDTSGTYSATVVSMSDPVAVSPTVFTAEITLDKKLPNDAGELVTNKASSSWSRRFKFNPTDAVSLSEPTDKLTLYYDQSRADLGYAFGPQEWRDGVIGSKVLISLESHRPPKKQSEVSLLKDISDELTSLRLQLDR